jgi:hypothetical protein
MLMRFVLFWGIAQHQMIILTDVLGQRIGLIFEAQEVQEDGTDTLTQHIGKGLPFNAV